MNYEVELSEKTIKFLDKIKNKDKQNFDIIIKHLRNLEQNPRYYCFYCDNRTQEGSL